MDLVENGNHSHIQQSSEKMTFAKCQDSKASVPILGTYLTWLPEWKCMDFRPILPRCTPLTILHHKWLLCPQPNRFIFGGYYQDLPAQEWPLLTSPDGNERLKYTDRKIEDTFRTPLTLCTHISILMFFPKWKTLTLKSSGQRDTKKFKEIHHKIHGNIRSLREILTYCKQWPTETT